MALCGSLVGVSTYRAMWLLEKTDVPSCQPQVTEQPLAGSGLAYEAGWTLSHILLKLQLGERVSFPFPLLFFLKKKEPRVRHDRHHDLSTVSSC